MRKRVILILIAVAAVATAIVVLVLIRHGTAPAATRLLPAADAYIYLDLATLRRGAGFDKLPKVEFDPEYAEFVRQTGFQFERDLKEAAFAVHLPSPAEANTRPPGETRYSEIFIANFDRGRVEAYLKKIATETTNYGDTAIYAIALPGRTVRVAILDNHTVAASNTEGNFVITQMRDRHQQSFAGTPELLRTYYREVPLGSVAWAVARVAAPGQQRNSIFTLPGGFDLFFPPETVIVASLRYLGAISMRAEAVAPNEEEARRVFDQMSAFLALFRTLELQAQGSDADVKQFFNSFQVTQDKNRIALTATVPPGFAKKLLAEAPATVSPPAEPEKPAAAPPAKKHRRTRR